MACRRRVGAVRRRRTGGAGTVIAGGVRRPFSGRLAAGFNSWRRWGEEQGVRGFQDPTAASNCSGVDSPAGMASGQKSQRGVAKTLELWSQGGSRGLGEAAARLMAVWGAAGRRVATAAPCSALTERGERRLGFGGGEGSGWGAGLRPWGANKGQAGDLGDARPVWKAGEIPGGGRGWALREEGDESGKWGQPVSRRRARRGW